MLVRFGFGSTSKSCGIVDVATYWKYQVQVWNNNRRELIVRQTDFRFTVMLLGGTKCVQMAKTRQTKRGNKEIIKKKTPFITRRCVLHCFFFILSTGKTKTVHIAHCYYHFRIFLFIFAFAAASSSFHIRSPCTRARVPRFWSSTHFYFLSRFILFVFAFKDIVSEYHNLLHILNMRCYTCWTWYSALARLCHRNVRARSHTYTYSE